MIIGTIALFVFGTPYFFWPFSGFIAVGFTWTIIEHLNATDKDQNINIFIDKDNLDN